MSHHPLDRLLAATARAEHDHFWFRGFRLFVMPLLAQATSGISKARLLDCGCGTGANLRMLSRFGTAWGIDITMSGVRKAREYGESRTARASVLHLPFHDAQFDVVTSFDVLYCLEEDGERMAVSEMYRVLKPGGHAIVNVAALEMLRGRHSILGGELRRYTRSRLRSALEAGGFEVRRITYTNATLFPLVLGVRLAQRVLPHSDESLEQEISVPAPPVNAILSTALAVEALTQRFTPMPFGSSVLCLARKIEDRRLRIED
jgi:ubiquinone/menaquinone biosynthesis C-methylase UbiE